jgi:quercetin dioxygenase-like cupin family protein
LPLTSPSALFRWDDHELDKVTEMVSRKEIAAAGQAMVQTYLKKGARVPQHAHPAAQWIYVLQGALDVSLAGHPGIVVREGEVLYVPAEALHQAEALDDTFVLDVRT